MNWNTKRRLPRGRDERRRIGFWRALARLRWSSVVGVASLSASIVVGCLVNRCLEKLSPIPCVRAADSPISPLRASTLIVWSLLLLCTGAFADVRETPHNLIKSRDTSVSEKQVCVFCHTPLNEIENAAKTSGGMSSPRWQKSLTDGFVYTIYDDIGRLGLGKASVGSQSIACLSCHDSNQAFTVGKTSDDHPFGVPYRGAIKNIGAGGAIVIPKDEQSTPFRAAQHLQALDEFRDVSRGTVEDRTVFWVSRNGVTARRTRNDLPLYARADTSDAVSATSPGLLVPHIECSSCHDPHTKTQTFLRVGPGESMLCLTCHDK